MGKSNRSRSRSGGRNRSSASGGGSASAATARQRNPSAKSRLVATQQAEAAAIAAQKEKAKKGKAKAKPRPVVAPRAPKRQAHNDDAGTSASASDFESDDDTNGGYASEEEPVRAQPRKKSRGIPSSKTLPPKQASKAYSNLSDSDDSEKEEEEEGEDPFQEEEEDDDDADSDDDLDGGNKSMSGHKATAITAAAQKSFQSLLAVKAWIALTERQVRSPVHPLPLELSLLNFLIVYARLLRPTQRHRNHGCLVSTTTFVSFFFPANINQNFCFPHSSFPVHYITCLPTATVQSRAGRFRIKGLQGFCHQRIP